MSKEKGNRLYEYNKLTESLEDLVGELQRFKVSTEDAVGSLKALVDYYSNLEGFVKKETKEINLNINYIIYCFHH